MVAEDKDGRERDRELDVEACPNDRIFAEAVLPKVDALGCEGNSCSGKASARTCGVRREDEDVDMVVEDDDLRAE